MLHFTTREVRRMNDASKRLPKPRYFGEEFGTPLAKWLNGEEREDWRKWAKSLAAMRFAMQGGSATDRKARARIAKLVEELLELSRLVGFFAAPGFRSPLDEKRLR